ncbi:glycosyltransferase family 1 protein [Acinetobacter indicus]|uniref:glycosyltransferase family 1 protein n=1 Tax=Acinetobacter indicus TaxID=756892 RepID=UPI0025773D30|nr:glycosyltransferase family 1 protein [Acinetobacter indicus]MDM1245255.1 glycosyltransferase [Acinetobacter indicus]MDM1289308.1 glycosyltransferase [Acinetobacter indicus]
MSKCEYFIGKTPPPTGGVTVFNQRKYEQLVMEKVGCNIILIEPTLNNLFKIIFALTKKSIKHVSASNFVLIILCCIFASRDTVIFYDHNSSRHFKDMNSLKLGIHKFFLKKCKNIILVDLHLKNNYLNLSNFKKISHKFEVMSAFLPPSNFEINNILQSYGGELLKIYNNSIATGQRNIILTSASKPNLDANGKDIYSIDALLDIFDELAPKYTDKIFIFAIAEYSDTSYGNYIKAKVDLLKNKFSNLIFLENNTQIWPIFKISEIVIRATTTDGDSVTIKEALHFGSKVIASSVVPRPENVILFDLESDDLIAIIEENLDLS